MAELERKYADKPVHFFHVLCGENPLQATDYRKHYRSEAAHLLDTDYAVSRSFRGGSWPTTVIVDAEGRIAGRWLGVREPAKWKEALAVLDECLAKATGGPPKGAYCINGVCFVRTDASTWDSQPTLVADAAGRLHLVFCREQGGVGDLFHQVLTGDDWTEPRRITRSAADDYAPHLCPDGDGLRLVFCSDRAASGKYDVWTKRYDGRNWSPPDRVTTTNDDAAHPQGAMDTRGNFWVTYYAWVPWGPGRSRDREVYVRHHDGKQWSDETQLSPADVPRYEDHADPAIAPDANGNVWVAWAWDTHPKDGWAFPPTYGSAIFARQLRAGQPPSQLMMVGMRARSMAAAKRTANWAFLPDVCCVGDDVWFAFEAHTPHGEHAAAITRYTPTEGFPMPARLGVNDTFVCTPRLRADRQGRLHAIWSAPVNGHYAIFTASADDQGNWSEERMVWADSEASLRTSSAAFDSQNRLWIATVRTTLKKSEVLIRPFGVDHQPDGDASGAKQSHGDRDHPHGGD